MDDENKEKNNILIVKEIKEKHRILTRKDYVYDSFDDEEKLMKLFPLIILILMPLLLNLLIYLFLFLLFII